MTGGREWARPSLTGHRPAIVLIVGLVLAGGGVSAEEKIRFERISVEQGLSQSTVFAITQDHQGYLWVGTEDGLNRFDAYDFRIFRNDPEDPRSISSNWVVQLATDPVVAGLWVMGQDGLDRFDPETEAFERFGMPEVEGREAFLTTIHLGASGRLYVGTDLGLFSFADGEFRPLVRDGEMEESLILRALLEVDGTVWLGSWGEGLLRFDPETAELEHILDDGWSSLRLRALEASRDRKFLWVGSDRGLDRFDLATREVTTVVAGPEITSLVDDGAGRLWIGSRNRGLRSLEMRSGDLQTYLQVSADPKSLSHDTVWSIFQDRDRGLWVGTGVGGGLNRVFFPRFRTLTHSKADPKSLPHPGVWSVHQDREGGYWIGNEASLIYAENLESGVTEVELSDPNVRAFADGPDGGLWIGTHRDGLYLLDLATRRILRHYRVESGESTASAVALPSNAIRSLERAREGGLWVGTHGGGLVRLHPDLEGSTIYPVDGAGEGKGTSHPNVWSILESTRGDLWIGTEGGGLDRWIPQQGSFEHYDFSEGDPHSLSSDRVWSLHEDAGRRLWVGTKDGGLNLYEGEGKFRRYTEQSSDLPNNTVYGILSDERGRLWLSTNHGIACFDPKIERFYTYESVDGLPSDEMNFGAFHRDSAGRLLFGGIRGLTVVPHPGSFPAVDTALPSVTELRVLDRRRLPAPRPGSLIELGHQESTVKVELSALRFETPSKVGYRYRLEGLEEEWTTTRGRNRTASYTSLPPGRYVFRARASNGDGVWSDRETSFRIHVRAPFWQSPVFWALLGGVGIALSMVQIRARTLRRRRVRLLLAQNRERDRIRLANELHDGPLQELSQASKTLSALLEDRRGIDRTMEEALQICRDGLDNASKELRGACYELLPPMLKAFGLEKATTSWLSKMQRLSPHTAFSVEVSPEVKQFSEERASQLFRLFQGFVHNALRHSRARHIRCVFDVRDGLGRMEIVDDGRGFVVPDRLEDLIVEGHLGLAGAAERVDTLGGTLQIRSRPGIGTRVLVTVPLDSVRGTDR